MLKNAKAKGARQELRAKRHLEANGYRVTKAGASLGEWDLIGLSTDLVILCQVKSNVWPSPGERKRLEAFDAPWAAYKTMWRYDDRSPQPRIKVWINPTGVWEWREINNLPTPFYDRDGARAIRFDFTVPPVLPEPAALIEVTAELIDDVLREFMERVERRKDEVGKATFERVKKALKEVNKEGQEEWIPREL